MGARPSALSLGRAWTGNISHFSTHSRVLEGTPRQDGPESYESHCFHHRHQTNKQASKQEENKTHGKSNDVQGIHLFERIFKTTQLSLSLSLAVYFFCFDVYLQTLLMASVHHLNLSAAKCAFVDFFATWSSSQFSAWITNAFDRYSGFISVLHK